MAFGINNSTASETGKYIITGATISPSESHSGYYALTITVIDNSPGETGDAYIEVTDSNNNDVYNIYYTVKEMFPINSFTVDHLSLQPGEYTLKAFNANSQVTKKIDI